MDKFAIFILLISITGCLSQGDMTIIADTDRIRTEGIYRHQFDNRNLVGNVHGSHTFGHGMKPEYSVGAGLDYTSGRLNGGLNVDHNFGRSTDVNANLGYNLYRGSKSSLDANANVYRTFTPYGNSPPMYGGSLVYRERF